MHPPAASDLELTRSDPSGPGIRRVRSGRGFRYLWPGGRPVKDARMLARVEALVIPPAWEDVWIGRDAARKRAVARVVREVADYLGNTPAVARASYIDPHVIEVYERGKTIAAVLGDLGATSEFGQLATQGEAERAVLRILAS